MTEQDQPGEDFDDELLEGEYPPEKPLAAEDDGVTGVEQLGGESFVERDDRTRPEPWEAPPREPDADTGIELVGDDAGIPDDEKDLVGGRESDEDAHGPLAPDDAVSGDETTRDVATERTAQPAEDATVQVDESEASPPE